METSEPQVKGDRFDPPLWYSLILVIAFVLGSWCAGALSAIPAINAEAVGVSVVLTIASYVFAFFAAPMAISRLIRQPNLRTGPNIVLTVVACLLIIRLVIALIGISVI